MGRLEDDAFYLMERGLRTWDEVLGLDPEERERLVEQAQSAGGDSYVGPQEDDVVGDARRLCIISIDPMTGADGAVVGEAWQAEDGSLHGSGIAAVMLFEPVDMARYRRASVALHVSPLSVLHARIARSTFLRAELSEAGHG